MWASGRRRFLSPIQFCVSIPVQSIRSGSPCTDIFRLPIFGMCHTATPEQKEHSENYTLSIGPMGGRVFFLIIRSTNITYPPLYPIACPHGSRSKKELNEHVMLPKTYAMAQQHQQQQNKVGARHRALTYLLVPVDRGCYTKAI